MGASRLSAEVVVHRRAAAFFIVLVVLGPNSARGQDALVLSAGGSRGLAHIGALVALDSLHHDPDLVVGVSMGAVVGSLYAAGYTPQEIWRIAARQDWRDLFKPMPLVLGPPGAVRLSAVHWGVELGRFEFSRGFMPDWRTNRTLVHLLFEPGVRARGDFDRLPRRYRALAAEHESGTAVVLAHGDFARAVRASMAESGLFSPVQWDGRVLIDGGVVDYLPVGLALREGGRRTIAVDVLRSEKPAGRDPVSMLRHAITLLVTHARADTTPPDFLIVPPLDPRQAGFTYPDDVEPLVQLGLDATLRAVPSAASVPSVRTPAPLPDSLVRLIIETPDSSLAAFARHAFGSAARTRYSTTSVLRAVDRIYASGFTESAWPRVDSARNLIIHVDPRPNGTLDLSPAYDNDRGGRIWAALQRRVSGLGAPTEFQLAGGFTGTERWSALSVRRAILQLVPVTWGMSGYWHDADARFVPIGDSLITQDVMRLGGSLGLEHRHIYPDHVLSASFYAERVTVADTVCGNSFGPLLRFTVPDAARIVGVPLTVEVEQRFGDVAYSRVAVRGSLRSDRNPLKIALVLDAAITDRDAPPDVLPALGDDRAMPGLRWGEKRGRARVVAGVDVAYPVWLGGHVRLRSRMGAAPLSLHEFEQSDRWQLGAEIAGVWTLPFASLLIGGGFTRGHSRFDVVLGSVF